MLVVSVAETLGKSLSLESCCLWKHVWCVTKDLREVKLQGPPSTLEY